MGLSESDAEDYEYELEQKQKMRESIKNKDFDSNKILATNGIDDDKTIMHQSLDNRKAQDII